MKLQDLSYGVMGFGRRQLVGVVGLGEKAGATTVSRYLNYDLRRRGLEKQVLAVDNPENLKDMDHIILVIDPLPSKIKENIERYRVVREIYEADRARVSFLFNKMNSGVDETELKRFLKLDIVYSQVAIPIEKIYQAEYMNRDIVKEPYTEPLFSGLAALAGDLFN